MTLETILNLIANALQAHGAHHVSLGAVNHVLGWVMTKRYIIKVCVIGSKGCGF